MNVWWCADGKYAELEQFDVCEVHVAGGLACGPMRLVPADALVVEKVNDALNETCNHSGHDDRFPVVDTAPQGFVCTICGSFYYGEQP